MVQDVGLALRLARATGAACAMWLVAHNPAGVVELEMAAIQELLLHFRPCALYTRLGA